jgi:hypothetical protein
MPTFFNKYPPEFTEFVKDGEKMAHMKWYDDKGSVEVLDLRMSAPICLSCWEFQKEREEEIVDLQ